MTNLSFLQISPFSLNLLLNQSTACIPGTENCLQPTASDATATHDAVVTFSLEFLSYIKIIPFNQIWYGCFSLHIRWVSVIAESAPILQGITAERERELVISLGSILRIISHFLS